MKRNPKNEKKSARAAQTSQDSVNTLPPVLAGERSRKAVLGESKTKRARQYDCCVENDPSSALLSDDAHQEKTRPPVVGAHPSEDLPSPRYLGENKTKRHSNTNHLPLVVRAPAVLGETKTKREGRSSGGYMIDQGFQNAPCSGSGVHAQEGPNNNTAPLLFSEQEENQEEEAEAPVLASDLEAQDENALFPRETNEHLDSNRLQTQSSNLDVEPLQSTTTNVHMMRDQQEDLVIARPVGDEAPPFDLPEAHEYDIERDEEDKMRREASKRSARRLVAWFILCGVITLVLGFVAGYFTRDQKKKKKANQKTAAILTISPTPVPTPAPTPLRDYVLYELLPTSSVTHIETSLNTSQAMAFRWLMNDPFLAAYPDWRLVQRFALATLYYATNGKNWYHTDELLMNSNADTKYQWLSSYETHECDWAISFAVNGFIEDFNVTTSEMTQYIQQAPQGPCMANSSEPERYRHLWLADNGLNGELPNEIWLLTFLQSINLNNNPALKVTISSEVGSLSDLQALGMGAVDLLDASLPSEIGVCSNLVILLMTASDLGGSLPSELGQLQQLEYLWLDENLLEGDDVGIPSEIGLLTSLGWLNLDAAGNMSGTTLPTEMGQMTALYELDLNGLSLVGTIPTEFGLLSSSLEFLNLLHNELTGTIPSVLSDLTLLYWLNLRFNKLEGSIPSELGLLSTMYEFTIDHNHFSGKIPSELGNFGQSGYGMLDLWLNDNELTGTIPSELGSIPDLLYLWLQSNNLSGLVPEELGQLNSVENLGLQEFDIRNNSLLSGTVPADLCWLNGTAANFDCSELLCGCSCNCSTSGKGERAEESLLDAVLGSGGFRHV
jgi:hypothetical protein